MSGITVQDIERDPAGFIRRIEAGESIVVLRNQHALAEIRPVAQRNAQQRPYGLATGDFTVPGDFDAPLPDEMAVDQTIPQYDVSCLSSAE